MAEVFQEPFCLQALHSGSISFGRFETEPLSWERRSAFSCNNYREEVEKYSKPGSVNQRKAYFEVFFKKKGLLQPPDSLFQNWTENQANEGELVDDSNFMELCEESLPECDEEISNNNSEHAVKESGEVYQPRADHMSLQREEKQQAYVKPKVKAENGRSHASSKIPENHQMVGKSNSSGLIKSNGITLEAKAELKTASTKLQKASSSNTVAKDSTHLQKEDLSRSRTVKKPDSNISTAKTSLSKTSKSMGLRGVDKQKQHSSAKVKDAGKAGSLLQSSNKRKDGSILSQSASRPIKVARSSAEKTTKPSASTINSNQNGRKTANKLSNSQSQSSSSSPVRRDLRESSASSYIKLLSSQHLNRTESPTKNNLPTKHLPVEKVKRDLSPSQTVCKPSKLAKLQPKSSSLSPVRKSPSNSSTIKQLRSQAPNRTDSPMKNNFPLKSLTGGKNVSAKKVDLDTSQTVTKSSKLGKLQSKSSTLSPVRRSPSESSTCSSLKQISFRSTNRSESPLKNALPMKCLPRGKEVAAKERDSDGSQTVYKRAKLENITSLSQIRRSPAASSKPTSTVKLSSKTNTRELSTKNNLPGKCESGGKETAAKKRDINILFTVTNPSKSGNLQHESSSPISVLKAAAAASSSTSSSVGDFSPPPDNGVEVTSKSNEKKIPANCPPEVVQVDAKKRHLDVSHSVSKPTKLAKLQCKSSSPNPAQNMKKSETPEESRNVTTKQGGTKKHNVNPLKHESISKKSTKSQGRLSTSGTGPVGFKARTNNTESLGRVESVKAVKKSESPRKDIGTGTLKRAVAGSNQMDKVGKKSRKVAAVR